MNMNTSYTHTTQTQSRDSGFSFSMPPHLRKAKMGVPKPRHYLLPHTTQLLPRLGEKSFGLDGSGSAGGCLYKRREGGLAGGSVSHLWRGV